MHLDVSVAREQVSARIEAALAAGGRVVDDSHAPSHWTLADRAGNRVCICAWPDQLNRTPAEEAAWPPRAGRETTTETEPGGVGFRPLAAADGFALRTATLANVNWAGEERFTHRDIDERAELRHYVDLRPDRGDFGYAAEGMSGIVGVVWLLFLPAESPRRCVRAAGRSQSRPGRARS